LNSYWNSAHVLVDFISGGCTEKNFSSTGKISPTYKANVSSWVKAMHVIIKKYFEAREIQSLHKENYQSALKNRMKAYLIAFNNGCVNLFSSVKYPRTFILLHKLGADIRQKNDQKRNIVEHIIDNKKIKFNIKVALLQYIKRVANDLIHEPSEKGVPPVLHCYKNNFVRVIRTLDVPFSDVLKLRTSSGKSLADLIYLPRFKSLLNSEQRLALFVQEGALETLFERAKRLLVQDIFPETAHALEIIVAQGRILSPRFISQLGTRTAHLIVFLHELGVKDLNLGNLELFDGKKHKAKNQFTTNFIGHFPLDRLPADMLSLLAVHLTLQDMISLFSVSKVMRDKFNSPHNSESMLWKIIAKNTFNKVKFSMREQIGINNDRNWKNILVNESRLASNWVKDIHKTRQLTTGAWNVSLSEHWGCWKTLSKVMFWNCETGEEKGISVPGNYPGSYIIDSSPLHDPIVALNWLDGARNKIRIISPSEILGAIDMPAGVMHSCVASLDNNTIVAGDGLALVDLTQQKVIKSLPGRTSLRHTVNKFSTSPMIISAGQNDPRGEIAVRFFDRNLNSIQNIVLCGNYYSSRIVAIDEHRILLLLQDGFRAFDMRNVKEELIASSFGVQYPPWEFDGGLVYQKGNIVSTVFDEINQRMVMQVRGYNFTMLWDLNTLTWSSVAKDYSQRQNQSIIAINSRYKLLCDTVGHIQVYDYS
jgi:hypothetical protein